MSGQKRKIYFLISVLITVITFPHQIKASYVLPYPSFMPGNKLYSVSEMIDTMQGYWSWGNIAQTKYALSLSDKKLVESKILFEYGQLALGIRALKVSDTRMESLVPLLLDAGLEGKDIDYLVQIVKDASVEHVRVLREIRNELPESVNWSPENESNQVLSMHEIIDRSVGIRENILIKVDAL